MLQDLFIQMKMNQITAHTHGKLTHIIAVIRKITVAILISILILNAGIVIYLLEITSY